MRDIAEPAQFSGPSGGLKSFGHSSFSTPGELFFLPSSASFPRMALSPCKCPQQEGAALFQHIDGFECPSSGPASQCPAHPRKAPHCFLPETSVYLMLITQERKNCYYSHLKMWNLRLMDQGTCPMSHSKQTTEPRINLDR